MRVLSGKWLQFRDEVSNELKLQAEEVEPSWTSDLLEVAEGIQVEAKLLLPIARRGFVTIEEVYEAWSQEIGIEGDDDARALKLQIYGTMKLPINETHLKRFSVLSWALAHALAR